MNRRATDLKLSDVELPISEIVTLGGGIYRGLQGTLVLIDCPMEIEVIPGHKGRATISIEKEILSSDLVRERVTAKEAEFQKEKAV